MVHSYIRYRGTYILWVSQTVGLRRASIGRGVELRILPRDRVPVQYLSEKFIAFVSTFHFGMMTHIPGGTEYKIMIYYSGGGHDLEFGTVI